jgi:glycosyltransferase involved in cell wall biosynthesis
MIATGMVEPFFSVIVPVRDGAGHLPRTLRALERSSFRDWELIVVDDGSADGTATIARAHGARLVAAGAAGTAGPASGAAAARNLGARHARGRYLLFLDADCEPHADTLDLAAVALASDPELDGVFGSYDDAPADPGFASQYKNLFHHYIHQRSRETATTFWTGCGAIRRSTFLRLNGFDPDQRMLEDVELGLRLVRAGGRLRLSKAIQVKHLKTWTLPGLLRSDVLDRAIPWAKLIVERDGWIDDLNLQKRDRLSAALALALAATAALAALEPLALVAWPPLGALLLLLNRDFYGFLRRRRGLGFALGSIPMHWFYFGYGALGLALGFTAASARRRVRRRPASGRLAGSRGETAPMTTAPTTRALTPPAMTTPAMTTVERVHDAAA